MSVTCILLSMVTHQMVGEVVYIQALLALPIDYRSILFSGKKLSFFIPRHFFVFSLYFVCLRDKNCH